MNIQMLLDRLNRDDRLKQAEENFDKAAEQVRQASERMEKRRRDFNRDKKNGARNSGHRFTL